MNCPQAHASIVIRILCFGSLLALAGCVPFEAKFAAGDARDPAQPLTGRWAGVWSSQTEHSNGAARMIVETASPSTCNLWLEMSGYRNVIASWIFIPDVALSINADRTEHFRTKVPIEGLPKQQVWAVAITLDGDLSGNAVHIHYQTNDAMRNLDAGDISLRRRQDPSPSTRPAP